MHSIVDTSERLTRLSAPDEKNNRVWFTNRPPWPNDYLKQNDYWASIPTQRYTRKMRFCEIVDMPIPEFLDIRIAMDVTTDQASEVLL